MANNRPKIEALELLARTLVGDDQTPDVFFVSQRGTVFCVTTDFDVAYDAWKKLAHRDEDALENRTVGVICSTEPKSEGSRVLVKLDESADFRRSKRKSFTRT